MVDLEGNRITNLQSDSFNIRANQVWVEVFYKRKAGLIYILIFQNTRQQWADIYR